HRRDHSLRPWHPRRHGLLAGSTDAFSEGAGNLPGRGNVALPHGDPPSHAAGGGGLQPSKPAAGGVRGAGGTARLRHRRGLERASASLLREWRSRFPGEGPPGHGPDPGSVTSLLRKAKSTSWPPTCKVSRVER